MRGPTFTMRYMFRILVSTRSRLMIFAAEKLTRPIRYGIGTALAAIVLALHWTLAIWVDGRIPFLLFIPTVALAAALLGRGPGLIVFIVGLVHGAMVFEPFGSIEVHEFADRISLLAYAGVGLFFVLVGGKARMIAQRAVEAEKALNAERVHAQKVARDNDARFRVALDTSAVPFNILSPVKDEAGRIIDFRWVYVNGAAADIFGQRGDDLIGRRVGEVLPGSWNEPGLFERYVAVSGNGESQSFELHSAAGGIEAWFHVMASPLQDSVVIWFADVTERKRQEQALREADQRKDEFLATLAHELRNPLAPIRQAAALSQLPNVTEEQRRRGAEVIERQVRNMALLLDDLLDVSRITRGMLSLRKSLTDVQSALDAAVETARPVIESRRHQLQVTLPPQPVYLEADQLRVAQVVANLLTNAAKYTDPGGRIELTANCKEDEVVITVTDNGIGIKPETLLEIFGMFAQIKSDKDRSHGGLGIGLALAKGLVELHGGRIEARSAGPGKGSQFTVHLPTSAQHPESNEAVHAPSLALNTTARKVLIADDNRDAADTLATLVELEGHQVLVAYDGEAALTAFASFRPDIALLDIGMPKLTGIEVAQKIRGAAFGRDATLVAITGWGQRSDRVKTMAAGFNQHLTKPVDAERVRQLLATEPVIEE
jgi:PAS domain S-box-containing protein